jgi:aminopeptidase N
LRQHTKPTPGQADKQPLMLPVRLALFDRDSGKRIATQTGDEGPDGDITIIADSATRSVRFEGLSEPPVFSLLRDFSAPVTLKSDASREDQLLLAGHDDNAFNRWQAAHGLVLADIVAAYHAAQRRTTAPSYDDALLERPERTAPRGRGIRPRLPRRAPLHRQATVRWRRRSATDIDPPPRSRPPSTAFGQRAGHDPGQKALERQSSVGWQPAGVTIVRTSGQAGRRSLRNAALAYSGLGPGCVAALARVRQQQLHNANNMTDRLAALAILNRYDEPPSSNRRWTPSITRFKARPAGRPEMVRRCRRPCQQDDDAGHGTGADPVTPAFSMQNPNTRSGPSSGFFAAGNPVAVQPRPTARAISFVAEQDQGAG